MKLVHLEQVETQPTTHDPSILRRILLHESEMPASVRLSHAALAPGQRVEAHAHADICEVFYVLSGRGLITVEGSAHRIGSGSCMRVDAGEMHAVCNDGDDDLVLLYFGVRADE